MTPNPLTDPTLLPAELRRQIAQAQVEWFQLLNRPEDAGALDYWSDALALAQS